MEKITDDNAINRLPCGPADNFSFHLNCSAKKIAPMDFIFKVKRSNPACAGYFN